MEKDMNVTEEFNEKVEEKVADKLSANYKVSNELSSLIARIEALNIFVAIMNAFLAERQKGENKLPDSEVLAIQAAVNVENAKTEALYKEIDELMKKEDKE